MKLLNEGCRFQCVGNPSILISASEQGNSVMKDRGKKVLTVKAKCKANTPLPCSFLTALAGGTPTNCQLSQLQWMMSSGKIKCNGNNVLTDASFINCAHGGVIRSVMSNCVINIGMVSGVNEISETVLVNEMNTAVIPTENKSETYITDKKAEEVKNTENIEDADTEMPDKSKEISYASHTLCDYENCGHRETCRYFNSQIYVENDSAQLKTNFINQRSAEWQEYYSLHQKKNMESKNGSWRIAAHHIISGNQVLMMRDAKGNLLYGTLVKLANYFGYDINNEWNCIMLPTNDMGFGELEQITKHAVPYDVMWNMKRQWHVGGHEYCLDSNTLSNITEYYKKHPEQYPSKGSPTFFSNYKEAMKEEMNILLTKYSKCVCWEKNYNVRRQKFFDDMNAISKRVEQYLLKFGDNPRKSFPFFVSKIAVEYAYDLPAKSKLIVVYKKKNQIRAKKIRLERYIKYSLRIVPIEKADIEVTDNKEFIKFCENAMHFYIDTQLIDFTLPFSNIATEMIAVQRVDFGDMNIIQYLTENSAEAMAFINQHEFAYQPIARVVTKRGGEK